MLKLDIAKAYDWISWTFFYLYTEVFWTFGAMAFLDSEGYLCSWFSMMVNRISHRLFQSHGGIR